MFVYFLTRGMGEKFSPSDEDFIMLAVWKIIENLAIPFRV